MSKFDENLFGRIAVINGYLSWAQLEEGLRTQRAESPPRRLGEILLAKGYLTDEQLKMILEIRAKKVRKLLRDPQEARESDRSFGQMALQDGHVTLEDLETAILEQERLARLGLQFRLGEILVAKSLMTVSAVRDTLRRQGKQILLCPVCDAHYNILGLKAGRTYRCARCRTNLVEPKYLDTVAVDASIEG
jgi:hypothetical protein